MLLEGAFYRTIQDCIGYLYKDCVRKCGCLAVQRLDSVRVGKEGIGEIGFGLVREKGRTPVDRFRKKKSSCC